MHDDDYLWCMLDASREGRKYFMMDAGTQDVGYWSREDGLVYNRLCRDWMEGFTWWRFGTLEPIANELVDPTRHASFWRSCFLSVLSILSDRKHLLMSRQISRVPRDQTVDADMEEQRVQLWLPVDRQCICCNYLNLSRESWIFYKNWKSLKKPNSII